VQGRLQEQLVGLHRRQPLQQHVGGAHERGIPRRQVGRSDVLDDELRQREPAQAMRTRASASRQAVEDEPVGAARDVGGPVTDRPHPGDRGVDGDVRWSAQQHGRSAYGTLCALRLRARPQQRDGDAGPRVAHRVAGRLVRAEDGQ
jgi:hypothetical protein